ncbi:hypothetical protein C8Q74DRAFT_920123 [Fomes fomentarius]|nr:hypothetical protein C8Q74DRAFT_920123 [Fomes fomentarius]
MRLLVSNRSLKTLTVLKNSLCSTENDDDCAVALVLLSSSTRVPGLKRRYNIRAGLDTYRVYALIDVLGRLGQCSKERSNSAHVVGLTSVSSLPHTHMKSKSVDKCGLSLQSYTLLKDDHCCGKVSQLRREICMMSSMRRYLGLSYYSIGYTSSIVTVNRVPSLSEVCLGGALPICAIHALATTVAFAFR